MDPFSPSRSPALTGLLQAARICFEDPERVAASHLKEHLRHVSEARRMLDRQYAENVKIRPKTKLFARVDPQVRAQFQAFRAGLKQVERYLEKRVPEDLQRGCQQARDAVESLLDLLAEMREEEETFPIYSESPFIHELTHLALGTAKGDIPPEILRERLGAFREQVKRTLADHGQMAQGTPESPRVAEIVPQMQLGLRALAGGLDEMALFYTDQQKDHLRRGGEIILKASEALNTLQKRLHEALVPSPICPRCSRQNPPGTRICEGCQSRLPEQGSGTGASLEVRVGAENEPPRFAYIVRLEEAVEAFLQGAVEAPELQGTLDWFRQRVTGGRQQLQALRPPERFPTPEAEAEAKAVRDRMEKASQKLADGAQRLTAGLKAGERGELRAGLELVREGASEMGALQQQLAGG